RRRSPYFRLEEESWRPYLTPARIAIPAEGRQPTPGRVTAFWSDRGGVGRATAVAQAASLLASRHPGRLLVVDLDFESPGLDAWMAPAGVGSCRGLRGL